MLDWENIWFVLAIGSLSAGAYLRFGPGIALMLFGALMLVVTWLVATANRGKKQSPEK